MLKVSKGKRQKPRRMFVYGPPGVGKSTFASMAPDSLFIPLEDGVDNLDVSRLDKLESWDEYESTLSQLIKESHSPDALIPRPEFNLSHFFSPVGV